MSTFHLLSPEKREDLCQMLPEMDQPSYLSHDYESPPSYNHNNNTGFFSKVENPIFWNTLSDWQTMLGQGEYAQVSPPSPSPPTNSSSNKSTSTTSTLNNHRSKPSLKSKKDKFKVSYFDINIYLLLISFL